jgi:transcription antitermination factor NusG
MNVIREGTMNRSCPKWYAIYTRSKAEFVVEKALKDKEIAVYLPKRKNLRHWKDRKKWVSFPLFPGYLFVYIQPNFDELVKVVRTRGVVTILGPEVKSPAPIPDEDIDNLRRLVESDCDIRIYPYLKKGTSARIKRGPLKGIEGILEEIGSGNECRFLITIGPIERSVSVRISADALEAT